MRINKNLYFFIFVILIIGLFVLLYLKYDKPAITEANRMTNLSIYAIDVSNGEYITTDYSIYLGGVFLEKDRTLKYFPKLKLLGRDQYIEIDSNNYTYYNDKIIINSGVTNISRVKLKLEKPGKFIIDENNNILLSNEIKFNVSTDKIIKNIIVCTKWSTNILWVKSQYPIRDRIGNKYNKCFLTNTTLNKDNKYQELTFNFKNWDNLDTDDYIDFTFMDSENKITGEINDLDYWVKNKKVELKV